MPPESLTQSIIAAAIDVPFDRERPVPVHYKGHSLDCAYRLDSLVAGALVLESNQ